MGNELSVVGKPVQQINAVPMVTGKAKYYSDVKLPGMLHAKILRSPHAQADIVSIDTTKAEALPGVELVMTYNSFPQAFKQDLHYLGDQVAAVIAADEETAEEACDLIEVEYNQKPFVVDLVEAMEPDSPQVFPGVQNANPVPLWMNWYYSNPDPQTDLWTEIEYNAEYYGFGDVEQGFMEADVIVEDSDLRYAYTKGPIMDPRGCVASFDAVKDKLTVWCKTQGLHGQAASAAKALGLSIHQVKVVSEYGGASFGGGAGNYVQVAGLATIALGKPVRLAYSRNEEMFYAWSRGSLSRVRIGFKQDGTLTTMDFDHWIDIGPDGGGKWVQRTAQGPTGCLLYSRNCQHQKITRGWVFTNRFESGGWQGYGDPETSYPIEWVMDKAAEVLNICPIELRKKNHFVAGGRNAGQDGNPGSYASASGITECLDACSERTGWKQQWQAPEGKTGLMRRGLGMAIFVHNAGFPTNVSSAVVRVFSDATAILASATAPCGEGQPTVQSQIVAEVLGIPYENVRIVYHDTDSTPWTKGIGASCGTWILGNTTYQAALDAKRRILEMAAPILEVNPEDIDIKDAKIYVKADPEKAITFKEAFSPITGFGGAQEIAGYHHGKPPDPNNCPKEKGAQFVSLDVDTETGEITNVKITHSQNVGLALNPKVVEGQFLGCRHGFENALWNDCITDSATGRLLGYNWEYYPVSTTLDCDVDPVIVEVPGDTSHPFGATACGEGPADPTMATFANAIYNAIGIRLKASPFTPDKILKALGKI